MKKITLLLMAVLAWVGTVSAQDVQSLLTFNWAHSVEGAVNAQNGVYEMANSSDGSYFVASKFSSKTGSQTVKFDGEVLESVEGALCESANMNLLLQKVSNLGSIEWSLHTRKGDVSATNLAPTSDGGLIAVIKTRAWDKGAGLDNLTEIVDGMGVVTTIKDMDTQNSEFRFLVLKINGNGKLEWSRLINGLVKTIVTTGTKITKDNATVSSCVVDTDGNIYLAGNYRTELNFKKADGSKVTLEAKSVAGWDGDVQKQVGDLFLVKLDQEGYYVSSLLADGTGDLASIDNMVVVDGKLFVNGRVKGTGLTLGGKAIDASASSQTLYVASVNASDLSVNYVNTVTTTGTIQNKAMNYSDGYLYLTGSLNGSLSVGTMAVSTSRFNGYAAKVNAETGSVSALNTVSADLGITYNYGVYVGADKVYIYGTGVTEKPYLIVANKEKLSQENKLTVCSYGTQATPMIASNGNLVMMSARGKASSVTFNNTTSTLAGFAGNATVYYSYKINDAATGISAAKADAINGKVNVYTTDGIFVKSASSVAEAKQGLAKGVYVVGDQKVVVE